MLPTLYEYYTSTGTTTGLSDASEQFHLNNKSFTILGGSMHYFRVHPDYWRDRLKKIKAAGLNTVDTYIPWSLHEPIPGQYDFGHGRTDFEQLLDVEKFLRIAQEEDLFVIVRPGPYICSEFDHGGLPSWLLRNDKMKLRTSDESFMEPVRRYFAVLFAILATFQFTKGGPIIAFQIENEYASFGVDGRHVDQQYLIGLKDIFLRNGIVELLLTSENTISRNVKVPGVLLTCNHGLNPGEIFEALEAVQPGRPKMVMEYWCGWFDSWAEPHHIVDPVLVSKCLVNILKQGGSVNFYMFHGGTTFGFLNGANYHTPKFSPVTNSYDYDAPLSETGGYTEKYYYIMSLVNLFNKIKTRIPARPMELPCYAYPTIEVTKEVKLVDLLDGEVSYPSKHLIPMELLPINNNSGQRFGYIVYRKKNIDIPSNSELKIFGQIRDTAVFLINGVPISKDIDSIADFESFQLRNTSSEVQSSLLTSFLIGKTYSRATLDILVENMGRVNFFNEEAAPELKGLSGNITLNGEVILDWDIYPLEFKKSWLRSLKKWKKATFVHGPTLYKAIFDIKERHDTFIDMHRWYKGIVIINGFVLSRYFNVGPQQSMYLPAPFLRVGRNHITIFEQYYPSTRVHFSERAIYGD